MCNIRKITMKMMNNIVGKDIGSSIGCNHNKQKFFPSMLKSKKIFLLDKRNEYKAVHDTIQPKNITKNI